MLVLTRKVGERIVIDGRIVVAVLRVEGDTFRIGIQAPADVPVHRYEVYEEIQNTNRQALLHEQLPAPKLTGENRS